jgi:hypothetical protein
VYVSGEQGGKGWSEEERDVPYRKEVWTGEGVGVEKRVRRVREIVGQLCTLGIGPVAVLLTLGVMTAGR